MSVRPDELVGRAAEFQVLAGALDRAAAGDPATVIVSGEAGIGKSRLVTELMTHARAGGWLVVAGSCSPVTGARPPYGPVIELLGALLRRDPDLPAVVAPEVWRSVGWLTGAADTVGTGIGPEVAAARLFAGVAELFGVAGSRHPLLVVVEDLHWVDPASLDLLVFAARKLRSARILLLVTIRPEDAPPGSPVRPALAEIRRLPETIDQPLDPLGPVAMDELLRRFSRLDQAERTRIAAVSDGNPFFANHLARFGGPSAVPPTLRDILLPALDGLSGSERALLLLLTVQSPTQDSAITQAASGLPAAEFNQQIRALVDRGLLVVKAGSLTFRHALLREVTAEHSLPGELAVAHSSAADALIAARGRSNPAEAAFHLICCGRVAEALGFLLAAAQQAASVRAFVDARAHYSQLRQFWTQAADAEAICQITYPALLREAAVAARWCGELAEADGLLTEALDGRPPIELRIDSLQTLGQVRWAAGDVQAALLAYQAAEALLVETGTEPADLHRRASVLGAVAFGLMATGNAERAEQVALASIEIAGPLGAERQLLDAAVTRWVSRAQLGDVDAAVGGLRDCLAGARHLDDLELIVRCYGNLTFALGIACRYSDVADTAAEGARVCDRYGPVVALASNMLSNQVSALISLGRWDEARQVAERALRDTTAAGGELYLRTRLAEVAIALGDLPSADDQIARAEAVNDAGNPYTLAALAAVRAERQLCANDPLAAIRAVREALPVLLAQDDALPLLEVCLLGLRALADAAELTIPAQRGPVGQDDSVQLLDTARRARESTALPVAEVLYRTCVAEAARRTASDSDELWATAADGNSRLGRSGAAAYCRYRLGAAQLRRRARSVAQGTLSAALDTAEQLRARPLIDDIVSLAAISGLDLQRPTGSAPVTVDVPAGLTPRERQVLELLITGSTNRLIARTLFISERTAGVHVSNILAKLGAANRTEAARIATRLARADR